MINFSKTRQWLATMPKDDMEYNGIAWIERCKDGLHCGEEFEIPEYIIVIDKDTLQVKTYDFRGTQIHTIKRGTQYKGTLGSGIGEYGTINGDWRPVFKLAQIIDKVFKEIQK